MSTGNRAGSPKRDAGTDRDRMFPRLTPEQMDRLASHGRTRAFSAGEVLIEAGDHIVPFFVVKSGELEIVRPDGPRETLIAVHTPGRFTGEANMISGRRALFRARVRQEVGFPFLTSHSPAVKVTVRG